VARRVSTNKANKVEPRPNLGLTDILGLRGKPAMTNLTLFNLIFEQMKKIFFLMLMLGMTSAAGVNAQVIIGDNSQEPHAGAILDLSPLGGSKKLGLLLPNVVLGATADVFVLIEDPTSQQKEDATGMLVYNNSFSLEGKGLYVWMGNEWKPVVLAETVGEQ
jgi:hypothetical protein